MTTERITFLVPIDIDHKPGTSDQIEGRWSESVEGTPAECHGRVRPADDGEDEMPDFMRSAIEESLTTEAGERWMLRQMERVLA